MFDLTGGELFILCVLVAAVLSWPLWPRMGEAVFGLFAGPGDEDATQPQADPPARSEHDG